MERRANVLISCLSTSLVHLVLVFLLLGALVRDWALGCMQVGYWIHFLDPWRIWSLFGVFGELIGFMQE